MKRMLNTLQGGVAEQFEAGKLSDLELNEIVQDVSIRANVQKLLAGAPDVEVKENRRIDEKSILTLEEVLFEICLVVKLRGMDMSRLDFYDLSTTEAGAPLEVGVKYSFTDGQRVLLLDYNAKYSKLYSNGESYAMNDKTQIWGTLGYLFKGDFRMVDGTLQARMIDDSWEYPLSGKIQGR